MFCPPDRWLVTSQPELHPGPITALTWLSPASSSPIAASPCFALHPESAQLYCNVRPGKSFLSAFTLSAASAAAPAMLEPTAHEPVVGSAARACVHQLWHCASMHACLRARVCAPVMGINSAKVTRSSVNQTRSAHTHLHAQAFMANDAHMERAGICTIL